MIDFHAHILPGIDDGAKDVKMSLDMLHESYLQGVRTVIATPHCYLMEEKNIDSFLKKRQKSYEELMDAIKKDERPFPKIILGCELRIIKEVPDMNYLKKLCIEGTDYLLVEMPYKDWNVNNYDLLYAMILRGIKPIIAHIERFWDKKKEFYNLYSLELLYQVNADAFIHFAGKRRASQLFASGALHIIGSDMHNTSSRASCMKKAVNSIIKIYGKYRLDYLMGNAEKILENKPVDTVTFNKKGLFY